MRLHNSCPRRKPQSAEELQQSSITFTWQAHACFCVQRGSKVNEFTHVRRGDKTEKNTEILAEATDNDVSIRVAVSSIRVDRVFR